MKKAIGYVRVSTEQQADEGISLEAQKGKIRAWCELNDYELVGIYEDAGISGKNITKRAGLQEALNLAKPDMALVVHSLSRLARSTKDCIEIAEDLKANKCDLVSLTEKIDTSSAMGEFFFTLIAALGQMERKLIGERTTAALAHKKANGEKYAPVPFGYKEVEGKLEAVKQETQLVAEIVSRRAKGETLRSIADWLNEQGIAGKQGGKWHASSVSYVLKRQEAA
ncbi:MAG: recombinase family protein [Chloroflexota bacterium]|nr:MAG: recombinase family protein [Chloroflexota bacterium]